MLCSHNPIFSNGKEALQKKRKFLSDFIEEVSHLHFKGHSASEIFSKLSLKEYRVMKLITNGKLSKMNMVKSVIRSIIGGGI